MNRAAINIYVQVFMWTCAFSFLEHVPWNGITASEGKSVFTCLKNHQIVFKCGCPILYSHQHCKKIPMSLRFCLLIITILVATWCKGLTHLKDPDAGRDWGQEEKGATEDEMVGCHHWHNGHGFGWTPGFGEGQGGLACCGSWGRKELNMTEATKHSTAQHVNTVERNELTCTPWWL